MENLYIEFKRVKKKTKQNLQRREYYVMKLDIWGSGVIQIISVIFVFNDVKLKENN